MQLCGKTAKSFQYCTPIVYSYLQPKLNRLSEDRKIRAARHRRKNRNVQRDKACNEIACLRCGSNKPVTCFLESMWKWKWVKCNQDGQLSPRNNCGRHSTACLFSSLSAPHVSFVHHSFQLKWAMICYYKIKANSYTKKGFKQCGAQLKPTTKSILMVQPWDYRSGTAFQRCLSITSTCACSKEIIYICSPPAAPICQSMW